MYRPTLTYWPDSGNDCKTNDQKLEYINKFKKHGPFDYEPDVALKFEKELLENGYIKKEILKKPVEGCTIQ